MKLSAEALEALLRAPWPGNIRELRNVLRYAQAVNEGGIIGIEDLPAGYATLSAPPSAAYPPERQASPETESLQAKQGNERLVILDVLTRQKWNIARASKELCISRPTLYKKMKQNDIVPPHKFDRKAP
jgi:transcriptional regulator of acetoin/glycerol metabolism